jgi:signal peptidase I
MKTKLPICKIENTEYDEYPKIITLSHKAVSTDIEYRKYAMGGDNVYYRLTHKEELEYEDEEVEEGDYMLSIPINVYRYLAISIHDDDSKKKINYELGDFLKEDMGDECLYKKHKLKYQF